MARSFRRKSSHRAPGAPVAEAPGAPVAGAPGAAATEAVADGGGDGNQGGSAADAATSARRGTKDADRSFGAWLKEIATIVVIALVLSFLIKTFLFRAFFIPSGSMEETLEIDDRIFVNQLVPQPFDLQRGDVVVFEDAANWLPPQAERQIGFFREALVFVGLAPDESQQHLVKRVIGLPGDRVVCCDVDGRITVNGAALEEPYLHPDASPSDLPFDVVVPEGTVWVMGDHRNASADSRANRDKEGEGFVDITDIEGKAAVIAWPLDRLGFLGNYPDVFSGVPDEQPAGPSTPAGP